MSFLVLVGLTSGQNPTAVYSCIETYLKDNGLGFQYYIPGAWRIGTPLGTVAAQLGSTIAAHCLVELDHIFVTEITSDTYII